MTLTQIRCAHYGCKNIESHRTYTTKGGEQRTMYHCSSCDSAFSETRNTPIAQLKTPIAVTVQVLSALSDGVGINAATRLYSVSKNSIYRWQERLSSVKKPSSCLPWRISFCNSSLKAMNSTRESTRRLRRTRRKDGPLSSWVGRHVLFGTCTVDGKTASCLKKPWGSCVRSSSKRVI